MKESFWYIIGTTDELKRFRILHLKRFNQEFVVFATNQDSVAVLSNRCPHRGASLAGGEFQDDHIVCPFHGIKFNQYGKATYIPANGSLVSIPPNMCTDVWPSALEHGFIWMWYGPKQEKYPPIPWFSNIPSRLAYLESKHHWKCHYTRCIENQLDFAHLPFVHSKTIGRAKKRLFIYLY